MTRTITIIIGTIKFFFSLNSKTIKYFLLTVELSIETPTAYDRKNSKPFYIDYSNTLYDNIHNET